MEFVSNNFNFNHINYFTENKNLLKKSRFKQTLK